MCSFWIPDIKSELSMFYMSGIYRISIKSLVLDKLNV